MQFRYTYIVYTHVRNFFFFLSTGLDTTDTTFSQQKYSRTKILIHHCENLTFHLKN